MRADYVTSVIRTAAGYLVAWLVSLPAAPALERAAGVSDATARVALTGALVFIAGTAYYAVVRRIERRWPAAGRLLGRARPPSYEPAPAAAGPDAETIARTAGAELVDAEPFHSAL